MPTYKVSWDETLHHELEIVASSEEEAEDKVLNGEFDKDDLETDQEFSGLTMIVKVEG
jgi:hypothetical protein